MMARGGKANEWFSGDVHPGEPGRYRRRGVGGRGTEPAFWSGDEWYAVSSKGRVFESPHRDQCREWSPMRKLAVESLSAGERFGMLRFVRDVGVDKTNRRWLGLFVCDCGCQKAMNIYEVKSGANASCGCKRTSPERLAKWRNSLESSGGTRSPKRMAAGRTLAKFNEGKERTSLKLGKSSFNIHARHFHISNESGIELKGWNLAELVRQNAVLFDEADLQWQGGVCRAVKGLYHLYQKNRPSRVWKGWRRVDTDSDRKEER